MLYCKQNNNPEKFQSMRTIKFTSVLLVCLLLASCFAFFANAEESSSEASETNVYKMSFLGGVNYQDVDYFNKLLEKQRSFPVFIGKVEPIEVEEGGSFVFPENTIVFRDYVFVGWGHTYKDKNGKTKTDIYSPGDTFENVDKDISFKTMWKRPAPIDIKITGFIRFVNTESYVEGKLPEPMKATYNSVVKIPETSLKKDGWFFRGWVDSDSNFYNPGDEFTVSKINPVLTAVWTEDENAVVSHKIVYTSKETDISGKLPPVQSLYTKHSFVAAQCSASRDGYAFSCWVDGDGKEYIPGKTYDISADTLTLTAKWTKTDKYFKVDISHNEGGTVTPNSTATVKEGGSVGIQIVPNDGFVIKSVTKDGVEQYRGDGTTASFDIKEVFSNVSIVVTFEEKSGYSVTFNPTENGVINRSSDVDGKYAFEVIADDGYTVKEVTVDGATFTNQNGIYIIDEYLSEDVIITAVFEKLQDTESSSEISDNSSVAESSTEPSNESTDGIYLFILGAVIIGLVGFAFVYSRRR